MILYIFSMFENYVNGIWWKIITMKLILVESQKLHQKIFWSFSNKVQVRFRKITILQPSFSNKLFFKLNLSKNDFSKSCCPKLIFFNEFFFRKDLDNFWRRKMTLKVRFLQFCESIFFVKKSPKFFLMQFLWFR